jgi:hypothetical protein
MRWTALVILAATLGTVGQSQTYTNVVVSKFDGTETFLTMPRWWGLQIYNNQLDTTVNQTTTLAPNVPGSGSLKCTADWTGTSGNGNGAPEPQLMIYNGLSGSTFNTSVEVSGYYYDLDFDLMIDPGSAKTANGDFGRIRAGVVLPGPSWSQVQLWEDPAYTNSGWRHIHAYIDPATPGIDSITGFYIYWPWQTDASNAGAIQGLQTFWVDNIIFTTNLTKPLNPPTATLKPAPPAPKGLHITSNGANQYDRNAIATTSGQSWVDASGPVTFSMTISQYPNTNYPSYQSHIMLIPSPGTETAPDWNEPNGVFLDIQNQANGTAVANFRYKTNQAGGNSMFYGSGALGSVTSTNGGVGTWSMTFLNNTNVLLTSPDGNTNTVSFPDEQAVKDAFTDPLIAYFGAQPNSTADIGQGIVLSNAKITGTATPVDDSFAGPTLDTSTWVLRATQPADVFIPVSDAAFILSWTLPDANFKLQVAPSLSGPWTDPGLTNTSISGAIKTVTVPWSVLPSKTGGFFRFVKPVATKLQVLLPGETAAPGTPSGKTGTPTPQSAGSAVNVVVNAVDDNWNVVTYVTDAITISSSDSAASLPADASLVAGTQTFSVIFGSTGSQTVTATDTTDSKKQAGTSAPVTVQ